jgi:PKD repeat protein
MNRLIFVIILNIIFKITFGQQNTYYDPTNTIFFQFHTSDYDKFSKGETYRLGYGFKSSNKYCSTLNGGNWNITLYKGFSAIKNMQICPCGPTCKGGNDLYWTVDTNLQSGNDYHFKFTYNQDPNTSFSITYTITTHNFTISTYPDIIKPVNNSTNLEKFFEVKWNKIPEASNYQVVIGESNDPNFLIYGKTCTSTGYKHISPIITSNSYMIPKNSLDYDKRYRCWVFATIYGKCYLNSITFTTRKRNVLFNRIEFHQNVTANSSNPNNLVQPGKYIRFKLRLFNELDSNLMTGMSTLRTTHPKVTITDSTAMYLNLDKNTYKWSNDEYEIYIDSSFAPGDSITFTLQTHQAVDPKGPWFTTFTIPVAPLTLNKNLLFDGNYVNSTGDGDKIAEGGETIEILPSVDNYSSQAVYNTEAELKTNHSFLSIWDNVSGVGGTVYKNWKYNYISFKHEPINPNNKNVNPESYYVFDYSNNHPTQQLDMNLLVTGYIGGEKGATYETGGYKMKWEIPVTINKGIIPPVKAGFSASDTTPCPNNPVNFTDNSFGFDIKSWKWSFSGGTPSTSNTQNPNVSYADTGNYDVSLIVSDGLTTDTLIKKNYITINGLPGKPQIYLGDSVICKGTSSSTFFCMPANNASSYIWVVAPPSAATFISAGFMSDASWDPTFAGTAYVSVKGLNSCGIGVASDPFKVEVITGPNPPSILSGPVKLCQGEKNIQYTCAKKSDISVYIWELNPPNAGTLSGNTESITIDWASNYNGNASLKVSGTNKCGQGSYSTPYSINVSAKPSKPTITRQQNNLVSSEPYNNQWYFNGAQVPGATKQTYSPAVEGKYAVEITNSNNCTNMSDEFDFKFVGVEENMDNQIKIFPNPTSGIISFEYSANKAQQMEYFIYNMVGKEVKKGFLEIKSGQNIEKLDLSGFQDGLYILKTISGNYIVTKEISLIR